MRSPAPSAKHAIASARLGVLLQRAQLTLCGGVLGPNVGTQRSPNCSPCKRNMSLGSRQCPNRCARAPPVRHCRRSLISISTNCSPSSRLVASGGIEDALSARTAVPELAQVGAQGPPARRSARLAGVASPARGSLLCTTWTSHPSTAPRNSKISHWGSSSYCRKGSTSGRRLTLRRFVLHCGGAAARA